MYLRQAIQADGRIQVALVGAGGKTTAAFQLARQFSTSFVSASAHLGVHQIPLGDRHIVFANTSQLEEINLLTKEPGITLITGSVEGEKTRGVDPVLLTTLSKIAHKNGIPLIIEADGSRRLPLKAPAPHEPPIPPWVDCVIVVVGMSGVGKPLTDDNVFRAETYSRLTGLPIGSPVTSESLEIFLRHPEGGQKNIPPCARRILLLNQVDTEETLILARAIARGMAMNFSTTLIGQLKCGDNGILEVYDFG